MAFDMPSSAMPSCRKLSAIFATARAQTCKLDVFYSDVVQMTSRNFPTRFGSLSVRKSDPSVYRAVDIDNDLELIFNLEFSVCNQSSIFGLENKNRLFEMFSCNIHLVSKK